MASISVILHLAGTFVFFFLVNYIGKVCENDRVDSCGVGTDSKILHQSVLISVFQTGVFNPTLNLFVNLSTIGYIGAKICEKRKGFQAFFTLV